MSLRPRVASTLRIEGRILFSGQISLWSHLESCIEVAGTISKKSFIIITSSKGASKFFCGSTPAPIRSQSHVRLYQGANCVGAGLFCRLCCEITVSFFVEVLFLFNWVSAQWALQCASLPPEALPLSRDSSMGDMADPRDFPLSLMNHSHPLVNEQAKASDSELNKSPSCLKHHAIHLRRECWHFSFFFDVAALLFCPYRPDQRRA